MNWHDAQVFWTWIVAFPVALGAAVWMVEHWERDE